MSLSYGVYKSLYPLQSEDEEDLSLEINDILSLVELSVNENWWKVEKIKFNKASEKKEIGLVPYNYIEKVCT